MSASSLSCCSSCSCRAVRSASAATSCSTLRPVVPRSSVMGRNGTYPRSPRARRFRIVDAAKGGAFAAWIDQVGKGFPSRRHGCRSVFIKRSFGQRMLLGMTVCVAPVCALPANGVYALAPGAELDGMPSGVPVPLCGLHARIYGDAPVDDHRTEGHEPLIGVTRQSPAA